MAKKPKPIGKNAPCPCGSGKVYKRCCLLKQASTDSVPEPAPESDDPREVDASYERFYKELGETFALHEKLPSLKFDFKVDLFDPVLDDLERLLDGGKACQDLNRLALWTARGMRRHVTPEKRVHLLETLESRLDEGLSSKVRHLLQTTIAGLEDPEISPHLIGCVIPIYQEYMFRRFEERLDQQRNEYDRLALQLKSIGKDCETGNPTTLREWLRGKGPETLSLVEFLLRDASSREGALDTFLSTPQEPSMRAARLVTGVALGAKAERHDGAVLQAMNRMPEIVWTVLLYRAEDREAPPEKRLRAYQFLAEAGRWEVLDLLLAELAREGDWQDHMPEDALPRVAALIARLGDRRAVGQVLRLLIQGRPDETAIREAVRGTFRENGWWGEIEEALAAHRQGALVFVAKGVEMRNIIEERYSRAPAASLEAANFRLGILNEEWNHAYHEDLEGLRPSDLEHQGPEESALMQEFGAWAAHRLPRTSQEVNPQVMSLEFATLQHEWMMTPQEKLGGRCPFAVIYGERRRLTRHPAYEENYRRRKISDLYMSALEGLDAGEREEARLNLQALVQVEPTHVLARRLLAQMSRNLSPGGVSPQRSVR